MQFSSAFKGDELALRMSQHPWPSAELQSQPPSQLGPANRNVTTQGSEMAALQAGARAYFSRNQTFAVTESRKHTGTEGNWREDCSALSYY